MNSDRDQEPQVKRFWAWLWRPKLLLALGGVSVVAAVITYWAIVETAKRFIPPIVEREISKILNRPIDVGEFEQLSLFGLRLSPTVIPIAAGNSNSLLIDQIDVRYQPWGVLRGRLPVQIEISGIDLEINQLEDGSWATIDLNLPPPEEPVDLPFDPQVDVSLRDVQVTVLPLGARDPLTIDLEAIARVRDNTQTAAYEVDLRVEDGTIALRGETQIKTLASKLTLGIQKLDLTDFNAFLPSELITLDRGLVNANLQLQQPAVLDPETGTPIAEIVKPSETRTAKINDPQGTPDTKPQTDLDLKRLLAYLPEIRGTLALETLQAALAGIREPLTAGGVLQFQGDRLRFDRAIAAVGPVAVKLAGRVDRRSGFDLRVTVPPVELIEAIALVEDLASVSDPLDSQVDADLTAEVNLNGAFDDPTLKLALRNVTPWRLDRLKIAEFRTNITVDRETLTLNGLRLAPAAGGRILARGEASIDQLVTSLLAASAANSTAPNPADATPSKPSVTSPPDRAIEGDRPRDLAQNSQQNPNQNLNQNPTASPNPPAIDLPLDTVKITGNLDLNLPLDAIAAPYELPDGITLGTLRSVSTIAGNAAQPTGLIRWELPGLSVFGEAIAAAGGVSLEGMTITLLETIIGLGGGEIVATGRGDLKTNDWNLRANSTPIDVTPILAKLTGNAIPLRLELAALSLGASVNTADLARQEWGGIAANLDLTAAIADGLADVRFDLANGRINLVGSTGAIDLAALLPSLPSSPSLSTGSNELNRSNLPVTWRGGRFELATTIDEVLAIAATQTLDGIALRGQADLGLGSGGIVAEARLDGGQLFAGARGGSIDLTAIARSFGADLPLATRLDGLDATLNADLRAVIAAASSGDWRRLNPNLQANLDLGLDNGTIAVQTIADANTWAVETRGGLPLSEALITSVIGTESPIRSPAFPQRARVDTRLSGMVAPLLDLASPGPAAPLEVTVDRLFLALGDEFVELAGDVRLLNLLTQPDLEADLQVAAEYDSDRLPITLEDVSLAVGDRLARRREVNVAGAVTFNGQFTGRQLIREPLTPGNVALTGDLELRNPAANDRVFDRLLTGSLVARTDDRIEINLQGERDRLMARLRPCDRGSACLSPFLPDRFELRYGSGQANPVVALGDRRGDRFDVSLDNFNLDLLNLSPATKLGINGPLQGDITAQFSVNLFDLSADGQLAIEQPGVGYLVTDSLEADFSYDDGSARLDSSAFNLGRTQYRFNGEVNLDLLDIAQGRLAVSDIDTILASQVRGDLTVEDGQLEDLLDVFKWSNVEDLTTRQLAAPSFSAADLNVSGVGEPELSLLSQLPGFDAASDAVRQLAAALRQPAPPRELDLTGTYDAQMTIGGTLGDPLVDLTFMADNWRWSLQPTINAIEPRLGFFREEGAFIQINDIAIAANYTDGQVELNQLNVRVDDAQLTASGTLSETSQDVTVNLDRLQLDTIRRFVPLPLDAAATISLQAKIGGNLQQPTVTGETIVDNIVLNSRPIDPITSRFDYADTTFAFATTSPDWLDIRAQAPLPLTPENNTTTIAVKVKTPALNLLSTLSGGSLEYVSGDFDLDLQASIGFVGFFPKIEAVGTIALDQTTVRSPLLPAAPLAIDGDINLVYDPIAQVIVDVDQIVASVAEGAFTLDGSLPLYPSPTPIETPLTFSVAQGELDLQDIYQGRVDGQIQVAGSGFRPVISGRMGVSDGRLSLPKLESQTTGELVNVENWEPPPSETPPLIQPRFDNFAVFIGDRFRAELEPIFNFRVMGDLALNGIYDGTLDKLQADGSIAIERGRVNVLSNLFFIAPGRDHRITFTPDRSPIDPDIDLELATLIYESEANSLRQRDPATTELPDLSLIPNRRSRQLLVSLGLDGSAQDLLAAVQASNTGDTSRLLDVVSISSVPSRDDQTLVALLGNQFITTVQDVAQLQGAELIEFAALRFAIEPTLTDALLDVDNFVNRAGHALGLTRLSIFPPGQVEGTIELTPDSLLRLTYDYGWNGLQLQNSTEETGANSQSVELRYEFRF
ncbi:MAG: DUF748 domain-containing protein [Oscillatoriales cyanobacterium]|nr:MAG: DUF748 domain-containing protein [Oscillatoriales cyanobacterium]